MLTVLHANWFILNMEKKFVNLEFFETYYYANILSNVIDDPFSYLRNIHSWYEDNEEYVFLRTFPKRSRLHGFAFHVIDSLINERIAEFGGEESSVGQSGEVWIDHALKYHGFPCDGFEEFKKNYGSDACLEDCLFDYHQELQMSGEMEDLVEHLSEEVFYVMFSNRKFLLAFNQFLAGVLQQHFDDAPDSELGRNLKAPGVLKRFNLPSWVKRAVFFRDKGMCSLCHKDLTGVVSSQPDSQYDHIVPLARGGLNDVTNIQLLCEQCNRGKSANSVPVSTSYEAWY